MPGVIEGGWEFVYAAFGVVLGGLTIYGLSLTLRLKTANRLAEAKRAGDRESGAH